MKKLMIIVLVLTLFSCNAKKKNVEQTKAKVEESTCTAEDCKKCVKENCENRKADFVCTGVCESCPKENCKSRKKPYKGEEKKEEGAGEHKCCGNC